MSEAAFLPPVLGLRHLALFVADVDRAVDFYCRVFGMQEEWRPDPDNAYLSGGSDNLALHKGQVEVGRNLDHFGFVVPTPEAVDAWEQRVRALGIIPEAPARTHRDGARSFYLKDLDGHTVQILYHPPISGCA